MEKRKKAVIIIIITTVIAVVGIGITLAATLPNTQGRNQTAAPSSSAPTGAPEPSEKTADSTPSEQTTQAAAEYSYNNLDGLYFIPSTMYDDFKTAVEQYLELTERTDTSKINVLDIITTEDDILYTFWILLSDNTILRGAYNYDLYSYTFDVETDEEIITKFIDTSGPDGIDNGDHSFTYAELSIGNLEELESVLPEEAYQRFPDELLTFLSTGNELRRLFTLSGITQSGDSISWTCTFDTPRIDRKNVYVTYSTSENNFVFSIED